MKRLLLLFMLVTFLGISTPVQAFMIGPDWVKFHPDTKEVINGATATITDIAGGVSIYMDATAFPPGSQDITEWYFNVGSDTLLSGASFNWVGGVVASDIEFNKQADGDGIFDLKFSFPTAGGGTFLLLKFSEYTITGVDIHADDFNNESEPRGGAGPFVSAIKNGEAYWAYHPETIPEPSTMLLLGAALIGLAGVSRFKK